MENQLEVFCPYCQSPILADAYFCPNCGKQLKFKPPATTALKQIVVYLVSFFLPPFGLWYAWKYFKAGDYASIRIGIISVVLTIASILLTIWIMGGFLNDVMQSLNALNISNI